MKAPQLSVFNFSMSNQTNDSVDINIDGYFVDSPTLEIYKQYWGDETSVSYKSFRDSIPSNVKTINLVINSGGGHVGDAMAIADYLISLEEKGVTVNRQGRGIVASAATYPLMGKNSSLSENCLFMIHEVSGLAYGDVSSMENQVKAMRKFNDMIVDFYCRETGLSKTVVANMMKAETWLTSNEAKEKGFVKNVGAKATITNKIKNEHWMFSNTAMLNTYNSFISNSTDMDTQKISEAINNGFNSLMEKLGLKDKQNDDNVKNAFSDFAKSITDSLKDLPVAPTNEALQKMVNDAIGESVKNLATSEAVKNSIDEAFKNIGSNEAFKNALGEVTKNQITKDDLKKSMDDLTNSIAEKLGNKGKGKDEEIENEEKKVKTVKNRFSGKYNWNKN